MSAKQLSAKFIVDGRSEKELSPKERKAYSRAIRFEKQMAELQDLIDEGMEMIEEAKRLELPNA